MKKTKALTLRNTDKTAPMVAQDELKGLYMVLEEKLNNRLEACYTEEDEEGRKVFYEPPDMKWYIKEIRQVAETISKLDVKREETQTRSKIDIMKIMQEQAKMSKEEREKARRKYIEVEEL